MVHLQALHVNDRKRALTFSSSYVEHMFLYTLPRQLWRNYTEKISNVKYFYSYRADRSRIFY
jgi:hypothetical protein